MRFQRIVTVILISALIFALSGCGSRHRQVTGKPASASVKYEVSVAPATYYAMMSVTPGLQLAVTLNPDISDAHVTFHWSARQGNFLSWQQQTTGKVTELGRDVRTDERVIYWSALGTEGDSYTLNLAVESSDTAKTLCETTVEVEQTQMGVYMIKG
jgi:hypothetical protein